MREMPNLIVRPGKRPGKRLSHSKVFGPKFLKGKKNGYLELNLTPMVDMFTMLVIFLIREPKAAPVNTTGWPGTGRTACPRHASAVRVAPSSATFPIDAPGSFRSTGGSFTSRASPGKRCSGSTFPWGHRSRAGWRRDPASPYGRLPAKGYS